MPKDLEYNKSLIELLDEMKGEKETMDAPPPPPELNNEIETDVNVDNDNHEPTTNIISNIPNLAELIVGMLDMGFCAFAAAYSKNKDKEQYKLEFDEENKLIDAWKTYINNTPDFKMSPSTILLATTALIYVPKSIMVFNDKKMIQLEKENQELKTQMNGTTYHNE